MALALLRMQDSIDYLQQSYKAYADHDAPTAKLYLAHSLAMERRAKRHFMVAHRGVER